MRIAALNDSSSESSNEEEVGPSEEVLEAEATRAYHKAIKHIAKSELNEAKESFYEVLNNSYIAKVIYKFVSFLCLNVSLYFSNYLVLLL